MRTTQPGEETQPAEKKPLTAEQKEAEKKREAIQEANRQFYWDNLKHTTFKIVSAAKGGIADEPESDPALASLSSSSPLPEKLGQGLHDLVYTEDKKEKRIAITVNDQNAISPTVHPRSDKEFVNCYQQIMRAYAVGMGINRIQIDFPNITKNERGDYDLRWIDLKKVLKMLDIAAQENMAITLGPMVQQRLAQLDPNNKSDLALRNEIYFRVRKLDAQLSQRTDLNDKKSEATHAFLVKGMNEAATGVKKAGTELKEAVAARAPSDEVKEKMNALSQARNILEKRILTIQKDMHPSSKAVYAKYDKDLTRVEGEIAQVKNDLQAVKANLVPEDVKEYDTLLRKLDSLEKQTGKIAQQAKDQGKTPEERVKEKIENLTQAQAALTNAVTAPTTIENYREAREAANVAVEALDQDLKPGALSEKQMEECRVAMEAFSAEIKNLEANINTSSIPDASKAVVEAELNSLAAKSDVIVKGIKDTLAPPEEREAAKINEIDASAEPEEEKMRLAGAELDTINKRLDRLYNEIDVLVNKEGPLTDEEIKKCKSLALELEKEEKSSDTNNDKWKNLIEKIKTTSPTDTTDLEYKQRRREEKMLNLQDQKVPLAEAENRSASGLRRKA